jgi:hypothetical protein
LVSRTPEFHDDVVNSSRKSGVSNQGESKQVTLFISMTALTQRDDTVGAKRLQDRRDRLGRDGGL